MSDNTAFFRKCISIYQDELNKSNFPINMETKKSPKHSKLLESNSFVQTSVQINKMIMEISKFINEVQTEYLLSNSREFSEIQKDQIDSTLKLQLNIITKKIESLKKVADFLAQNESSMSIPNTFEEIGKNLLTMGDYSEYTKVVSNTIIQIRSNIVKALGLRLTEVTEKFMKMNTKRMERKRELDNSILYTSTSYTKSRSQPLPTSNDDNINLNSSNGSLDEYQTVKTVTDEYKSLENSLDQQQLELLHKENEKLSIELKNENLKSVGQIEHSMVEISSMINEISLQLNLQNDSITELSNFQDDILLNVKSGNVQLVKANERAKNATKRLFYIIIAMGLFLLIVDYIL